MKTQQSLTILMTKYLMVLCWIASRSPVTNSFPVFSNKAALSNLLSSLEDACVDGDHAISNRETLELGVLKKKCGPHGAIRDIQAVKNHLEELETTENDGGSFVCEAKTIEYLDENVPDFQGSNSKESFAKIAISSLQYYQMYFSLIIDSEPTEVLIDEYERIKSEIVGMQCHLQNLLKLTTDASERAVRVDKSGMKVAANDWKDNRSQTRRYGRELEGIRKLETVVTNLRRALSQFEE